MSKYKGYQKLIRGCESCPDFHADGFGNYKCTRILCGGRKLPKPDKDYHVDFPDWCPLEDVDL